MLDEHFRFTRIPNQDFTAARCAGKTVAVTHELWPKEVWHGRRMTATDAAPIRDYRRKAARERAQKLDAEAKEYRAALETARVSSCSPFLRRGRGSGWGFFLSPWRGLRRRRSNTGEPQRPTTD